MGTIIALVLAGSVGAAVSFVLARRFVLRAAARGRSAVRAELAPGEAVRHEGTVNCFGVASGGVGQVRGNGTLVITDARIVFALWSPTRVLPIDRASVTAVDRARSHLAKTRGVELLRITWVVDGSEDSAAFQVDGIERWEAAMAA
jgi:hypothetical protein